MFVAARGFDEKYQHLMKSALHMKLSPAEFASAANNLNDKDSLGASIAALGGLQSLASVASRAIDFVGAPLAVASLRHNVNVAGEDIAEFGYIRNSTSLDSG